MKNPRSMRPACVAFAALFIALGTAVAQGPPRRTPYESRCGSEIPWVHSLEEAKRLAGESNRPILWYVPTGFRTPMDRKQELDWYVMGGIFMDPDVIAWVNARFVPLKLGLSPALRGKSPAWLAAGDDRAAIAERYGLSRPAFVEPGIYLLDRNLEPVHLLERISTWNSTWLLRRLQKVVRDHPVLDPPQEPGTPIPAAGLLARGEWKDALAAARSAAARGDAAASLVAHRAAHFLPAAERGEIPVVESESLALLRARAALGAGEIEQALAAYDVLRNVETVSSEATYFAGVCRHLLGRTKAGDDVWRKLIAAKRDDRWAWKAQLELDRWGPFIRGFEEYRDYPEYVHDAANIRTSRAPGDPARRGDMVRRALDIVLALQREDGGWDDSRYDFGGLDSLPNVYVAGTAIAAWGLLEWRAVDAKRLDPAIDRAIAYLMDESNVNAEDQDELLWAHTYRLLFLARALETRVGDADGIKKKMAEIVRSLERIQIRDGAWRHEYPNPFATASALHALAIAQRAGVAVNQKILANGAEALKGVRSEKGTFPYGMGRREAAVEAAAGRMPLCELALFVSGHSTPENLKAAIEAGFEHHGLLETIRKFDNHADRYGYGGFFFWYDVHGRSEAIRNLGGAAAEEIRRALEKVVYEIHEAGGGWIDSHELGKSYGTAMGLIVLKQCEGPTE